MIVKGLRTNTTIINKIYIAISIYLFLMISIENVDLLVD